MAEMDADGDERISVEELCAWWADTGRGPPPPPPQLKTAQLLTRRLEAAVLDE